MVDFGADDSRQLLKINNMCYNFGLENCRGLLFFHSFTGCDYTPSFFNVGKIRWWDVMITEIGLYKDVLNQLSTSPPQVTNNQLQVIIDLTLKAYRSDFNTLAPARLDSISHGLSETFRSVPPTIAVLKEHVKRSTFIAGYLWAWLTSVTLC